MEDKKDLTTTKTKEKSGFLFGLISGVAVIAVIGMIGFGILYFTKDNGTTEQVADGQNNDMDNQEVQVVDLQIEDDDHVLGSRDAKVKVFEFSDFQCPYCAMFHEVMHQIVKEYPNDVAWVYKQFPIQSHPMGLPGAVATECAAEQGKFWEMSDIIFANQQSLEEGSFVKFADEIGLDSGQFATCYENNPYNDRIAAEYNLGISLGVGGTPTNFVNGQMLPGALPYDSMKSLVEQILAQ